MNQQVTLGRTQSGKPGLFTGGYMAVPLSEERHAEFTRNPAAAVAYCARCGFTYVAPQ